MKPDPKKPAQPSAPARPIKGAEKQVFALEGAAAKQESVGEPRAGVGLMPVWLIIVCGALFYWGEIYMDSHAGGFNPKVYGGFASLKDVVAANPRDEARETFVRGEALYGQICSQCHQPSGLGTPGQFPPLAGSEWVLAADPARLIRIPLHGLIGPIEVKGQQWNATMLPFGGTFQEMPDPDGSLAAVLTYIRQAWGNSAPIVKAEQVKIVREATKDRTAQWTASELLQVPLQQ